MMINKMAAIKSTMEKPELAGANQSMELRRAVLSGAFDSKNVPPSAWKSPTGKIVMIASSTFTDTQAERNYLMEDLLFKCRDLAKFHGM
jgi:hypothetical protein